jgi:hypothetical protein
MSASEIPRDVSPKGITVAQQVLDVVVMHPEFQGVIQEAVDAVNLMIQIKMPAGFIVLADTGMGKTLLFDLICRQLSSASNIFSKERPVLRIELDSAVDTHKMAGKVMLALGYPMLPSRPNLENMTQMIDTAMARVKPKALLVDESQHMCEGNREITARALTDWLKVRMDKHNLPVIAGGTKTFDRIFQINPQFVSRASAAYVINPFQPGDSWQQLIKAFVVAVKLVDISCIEKIPISRAIQTATLGNLRRLKKLLVYASINAADRQPPVLTESDLEIGFDKAFGVAGAQVNPFRTRSNRP